MKKFYLLIFLLSFLTYSAFAQTRTIEGIVTSADKSEPLVGVTVKIKGSTVGTQTDVNGKFKLRATDLQNVTITITYIGYTLQEQTLKPGQTNLNVKLNPSTETSLNDVVVTAYGSQKRITATGSIATVDLKKVEDIPSTNLSVALRGTVPGLSVSGGTQRPGQPTTITVRNPVVLSKDSRQGTSPLFVIDDVIRTQTDFDLLDPNEVENVSILKDAETAIYGVNGANGVILVRTKHGRAGAPRISFSSSVGASSATMLPKMMSGVQLATWLNDYAQGNAANGATTTANQNKAYYFDPATYQAPYYNADGYLVTPGVRYDATTNTVYGTGTIASTNPTRLASWYTPDELSYFADHNHNYLKEAFKTSYVEREALNVSGGTDKATWFIGGDYVNQNSNFKGVNSYKYGLRASLDAKVTKRLSVFMSLSEDVSYTRSYWYKFSSTTESLDNDARTLEQVQPWQEYFINGNPVTLNSAGGNANVDNINFFQIQNSNNYTGGVSYVTNMLGKINYEIPGIKGLNATFTMNKNINSSNNKQFGTSFLYYNYSGQGANNHIPGGTITGTTLQKNGDKVRLTPTFANSYQLDAGLNYNRTFGKHTISALALFEQREQNTEGVAAESDFVVVGALPYQTFTTGSASNGGNISTQSGQLSQFGFQSFISRVNYDYANKYLFQAILRADGSSLFPPGHNWGYFPSASIGWVASEEPFIKNKLPWVDLLKFRASVGLTGTDATKAYQYAISYNLGTGSAGGAVFNNGDRGTAIKLNNAISNPDVTWDHNLKTNYGMDVELLKNRLSLSVDYFWNHGYDILINPVSSVPSLVGATAPSENYSIVNTFGYEIAAGWRDHVGKSFTYSFSPFLTWYDNKNIKIDVASGDIGSVRDLTGKSSDIGTYGYKSLGIIRTQADANAIIQQRAAAAGGAQNVKILGYTPAPGMINYVDQNNDGVISTDNADRTYLNNKANNHYGLGLNWSVGYAGINLNVIMGMSFGGWTTIDGIPNPSSSAPITENKPVYWADHWSPTNPNAKFPAPYYYSDYNVATDFWLRKGTTFNITSANLSYTLPTKLTGKVGIASARFYVVATNPAQFINPYPNHYRDFGAAIYSYPNLKTISLGLNVGF